MHASAQLRVAPACCDTLLRCTSHLPQPFPRRKSQTLGEKTHVHLSAGGRRSTKQAKPRGMNQKQNAPHERAWPAEGGTQETQKRRRHLTAAAGPLSAAHFCKGLTGCAGSSRRGCSSPHAIHRGALAQGFGAPPGARTFRAARPLSVSEGQPSAPRTPPHQRWRAEEQCARQQPGSQQPGVLYACTIGRRAGTLMQVPGSVSHACNASEYYCRQRKQWSETEPCRPRPQGACSRAGMPMWPHGSTPAEVVRATKPCVSRA